MVSSDGTIHKCTLVFGTPNSTLGNFSEDGKKMNVDEARMAAWIGEWNYCKHLHECAFAPLCFGDHCPLPRITGERSEGELCCPEIKIFLDILLQCINRFHPFETITFK